VKILCTGDLHIGRSSTRLPAQSDVRALSAADCWVRIVDMAMAEGVAAVLLSGDVVDRANRFFEAVGPLEAGLRRLAEAGIPAIAVSGNHDFDVLPALAAALPPGALRLLGRGGVWERTTLGEGDERLHVDGWSYPEQAVRGSPLPEHPRPARDGVPVLGLLHCDLDQIASAYAPVRLAELLAVPVDFWLLGHIHAPALRAAPGAATVLYPGSPQALDPGEPGAHGPWLVEVGAGGRFAARQVPLSGVRYETVAVDLTDAEDELAAKQRIFEAVRSSLDALAVAAGPARYASYRIRLTGRTRLHRALAPIREQVAADFAPEAGALVALVEQVRLETRPAVDLAALAAGRDPAGVLAGLLLALEPDGAGPPAELLFRAEQAVASVWQARPYVSLGDAAAGEVHAGAARDAAVRQAWLLLDALLAQKEAV
jgi:DNA repair protein SbcD/Mre11